MASSWGLDRTWTAAWCALVLAFPWSNAFMSVATAALGFTAIWTLWQGHRPGFRQGLGGWALVGLVLWTGCSAMWSMDVAGALQDVRVKLPLLVAGLAWWAGSTRSNAVRIDVPLVLRCAAFSAMLASCTLVVWDVLEGAPYGGRSASRFISHIRFGLWWAVLLPWVTHHLSRGWAWMATITALLTWTWTESLTGLVAGVVTSAWWAPALWAVHLHERSPSWPEDRRVGRRLLGLSFVGGALVLGVLSALPTAHPDADELPVRSSAGEAYVHFPERRVTENGHFIWTHVAWGELASGWKQRSDADFDTVQPRLIRFLTSKGLTKDAEGVADLTDAEVEAIESGYASVVAWRGVGWARRWNRVKFNWGQWLDGRLTGDASLLARSVYQQTAVWAIADGTRAGQVLFGTGSGDAQGAMQQAYETHRPDWPAEFRYRPHQQYLSLMLGLGLVGLALWIMALMQGWTMSRAWPAILVLALSGLTEDTLQTQAGVTLALWCLAFPAFINPR